VGSAPILHFIDKLGILKPVEGNPIKRDIPDAAKQEPAQLLPPACLSGCIDYF
jgi:hypothetical protein